MNQRLSRRRFLAGAMAVVAAAAPAGRVRGAAADTVRAASLEGQIMTVTGPIPASSFGRALIHEHVTSDFLGAEKAPQPRYDRDQAFRLILPEFKALRERGVRSLVECTPAYIGRDVRLLRDLSRAADLQVVTNTGYYAAVDHKFLPRHAFTETREQVAARWLKEAREGIEGTGIRPGFIKLGTGRGRLPEVDARLLRAACDVHRETGLALAVHTGDGDAARDEVRILTEEKIAPDALIWVHAQNDLGPVQIELARRGVWISLDGYSLATMNPVRYRNFLLVHRREGTLGRVLISHDDGWAAEGEAVGNAPLKLYGNGNPRPYASVFERLLPDLRAEGVTEAEIDALLVTQPAQALALRRRLI